MTKRTTREERLLGYPELDAADRVRTVSLDEVGQMAVDVKTAARLTSLSEPTS